MGRLTAGVALGLVSEVVRWSVGGWLLARVPRCRVAPRADNRFDCSIIIPARDEAQSLPGLLASLLHAGDGIEIIVVDDGSTDGTAEVASVGGARVIVASALPVGWTGKAWACATGARAATSRTLVFLDADTTFEAGGFARVMAESRARRGLVSVQPYHSVERPYEHLSAFFNVIGLMGVDACTPLGERVSRRARSDHA